MLIEIPGLHASEFRSLMFGILFIAPHLEGTSRDQNHVRRRGRLRERALKASPEQEEECQQDLCRAHGACGSFILKTVFKYHISSKLTRDRRRPGPRRAGNPERPWVVGRPSPRWPPPSRLG